MESHSSDKKNCNVNTNDGGALPVMEMFMTLQGEGYHTGKAAFFIRIGGCDVGCHWCDVKESWNPELHPLMRVEDIISEVKKYHPLETVVITGGEPLMWNLSELTAALKQLSLLIHLETSGSCPLSGVFDWICLSPKKTGKVYPEVLSTADELKVIIYNQHDFQWAEQWADKVKKGCRLYLQPEWSRRSIMLPHIIKYIQLHPEWTLSLQTHKYIGIP